MHVGQTFLSVAAKPHVADVGISEKAAYCGFAAADKNVCPTAHEKRLLGLKGEEPSRRIRDEPYEWPSRMIV